MFGFKLITESEYGGMKQQIEDLKKVNADLLAIALNKHAEAPTDKPEEEMTTRPARRLVKDIRGIAEKELLEKHLAAGRKAS